MKKEKNKTLEATPAAKNRFADVIFTVKHRTFGTLILYIACRGAEEGIVKVWFDKGIVIISFKR